MIKGTWYQAIHSLQRRDNMAGDVKLVGKFTKHALTELTKIGLELTVLIDISHNVNFQTTATRHGQPAPVIAKPVELDIAVGKGTCTKEKFKTLRDQHFSGPVGNFLTAIEKVGGFERLNRSAIKVEAAQFDNTIASLREPVLADAMAAARAPDAAAFNALTPEQRSALGMYHRVSDTQIVKTAGPENPPRTA